MFWYRKFTRFLFWYTQAKRQFPFSEGSLATPNPATREQGVQTDAVTVESLTPPSLFDTLPQECVVKVLKFLDLTDMFTAERVCRRWRALLVKYFWGELKSFNFQIDVEYEINFDLAGIAASICIFLYQTNIKKLRNYIFLYITHSGRR